MRVGSRIRAAGGGRNTMRYGAEPDNPKKRNDGPRNDPEPAGKGRLGSGDHQAAVESPADLRRPLPGRPRSSRALPGLALSRAFITIGSPGSLQPRQVTSAGL